MGFFDAVKKGANLAKQGLDKVDEIAKKKASQISDSELKSKDSSNRYIREELQSRGL